MVRGLGVTLIKVAVLLFMIINIHLATNDYLFSKYLLYYHFLIAINICVITVYNEWALLYNGQVYKSDYRVSFGVTIHLPYTHWLTHRC